MTQRVASIVFLGAWLWRALAAAAPGPQDFAAVRQGCEQGSAESCATLGHAYRLGQGVAVSLSSALGAFERACEMGSGSGCTSLGTLHQRGRIVPKDPARAAALSEQGCELGDGNGCVARD